MVSMDNRIDLYRQTCRAAVWGLSASLLLGAIKLLGGLFGHSLALLSDAVHSLVDAVISLALIGALILAQRPADREHPYGHARVEALAGAAVALLLIALATGIAWEVLATLKVRHPAPEGYTLAIAIIGAVVQEGLYRHAGRVARRTGSKALLATAWDYRLDALGGLIVAIGVGLAKWGGTAWDWADHAAALAVAATVLYIGGRLLWDNTQALMDHQADPDVLDMIRNVALAVPGVLDVEKLRVRRTGLEYLVDIHVQVDPDQTVREGHNIAHAVKDHVIGLAGPVRDVLVHIEPHSSVSPVSQG